ncbi:MAG: ornithine carbamoyltransferase [Solirubrobacteraceae bacterium]|nr:ornithine carbamoyltransferase [Solirubrobacteraceae bacterium]
MSTLHGRSFLKEVDFTKDELQELLELAGALKIAKHAGDDYPRLRGQNIALIFEKSSTRTRCAFEVAAHDQGAHVTYLDPSGSQMGHKESVADTAAVLGRMFDAIEYRGSEQAHVEELARCAGVPVFNGLTNEWHPTQMLADLMTMQEHTASPHEPLRYAFVGDGRYNMGRSLLVTGAIMGADVRLVTPAELRPPQDVIELAERLAEHSGARITITDEPDGVEGVEFVHTDVWVSMGEPKAVWAERATLLQPFQVNRALLERTGNPAVKFMHCLPAFHDAGTTLGAEMAAATGMTDGLEVTDEVFRSPASIVFDQAENRLHTIKAVLVATLGQPS